MKVKTSTLLEARENAKDQVATVSLLIGQEVGVCFLDQSQKNIMQNQCNAQHFGHLIDNFFLSIF